MKLEEVSIADKAFAGVKRLTDSHWDLAVQEGILDHAMSRGPTTNQKKPAKRRVLIASQEHRITVMPYRTAAENPRVSYGPTI
ncbi:MAG: hypothetical protein VX936_01295 [Planctomycetota bacterium]|nr:hypothetical protein [Planctomycetota bacterium]